MLLVIYRLGVFLAAIIIGASSAFTLWRVYSLDGFSVLEEARGVATGDRAASEQFETTAPRSIETVIDWAVNEGTGERRAVPRYSIIPLFIQDKGRKLDDRYSVSRFMPAYPRRNKNLPNGLPARSCPIAYASNILIHYYDANETVSVFTEEDVAIVQYALPYGVSADDAYVLIDYVQSDSDNDGLLTCNDARALAVYDVVNRQFSPIDLDGGEAVWSAQPTGDMVVIVGVGIDENNDGLHDRTRERIRVARYNPETKVLDYLTP